MIATVSRGLTLEEYLTYQPEDDAVYELENGELREMPPESDLNRRIAMFLLAYFLKLGVPIHRISQKTEIAVSGSRVTVRIPDLLVLSEDAALALREATRSTILLDMPTPELVIEVVSPGKENVERDYRYKRAQYQSRGINEYWIVDPLTGKITVLTMNEGLYDEAVFEGSDRLISNFLQQNNADGKLTAAQVLQN